MQCKRNPAIAFYLVNLWTASWHQVPAASLEDDDEYLCDVAQCDPKTWPRVRQFVLAGFEKCSDGRLYHHYVAQEANKAWQLFLGQRARTQAATAARKTKQKNVLPDEVPPEQQLSPHVTSNVTNNVTSDVTCNVTSALRSPQDKTRQREEERTDATHRTAPPSPDPHTDVRAELWRDGLPIVLALTGRPGSQARAILGRLVKAAGDDCAAAMRALRYAAELRPVDPEAWLMAACARPPPVRLVSPRREKILRAGGLWPDDAPILTPEKGLRQ